MTTELLLASSPCGQCLTSRDRIVSGERAAQIVRDCRRGGQHFVCHKAQGQVVHCRGVHDLMVVRDGGSLAWRFARAVGIPVRETDPETRP